MKILVSVAFLTLMLVGCDGAGPTHTTPLPEAPIAESGPVALSPSARKVTGDIVNTSIGSASAQVSNPTKESYDGHLAAYCVTQRDAMDGPAVLGQYLNPISAPVFFTLEPGKSIAPADFGRINACRRSDGSYCLTQGDLGPGQPFERNPHYTSLLDHHYIGGQELCEAKPRPTPTEEDCPTCREIKSVLVVSHQVTPSHLSVYVGTKKPMNIVLFMVKVDWDSDGVMDENQTINDASGGSVRFELKSRTGVYEVHAEPQCGGGHHRDDDHGPCCHWNYRFAFTK